MTSFQTYNQFDKRFAELENFGKYCNACPLFALFSAKHFMENSIITKLQHEQNLDTSIANYLGKYIELPQYMSFDELLQFSGGIYNGTNVNATTPDLINQGIIGYEHMFKEDINSDYCVIFLKNSNFIIVLVKQTENGKLYCFRDCHETEQYNFNSLEELQVHLNVKYQFNNLTVVDGVLIPEFSNIEFLVVNKSFDIVELD
jgi:hypothetical protein